MNFTLGGGELAIRRGEFPRWRARHRIWFPVAANMNPGRREHVLHQGKTRPRDKNQFDDAVCLLKTVEARKRFVDQRPAVFAIASIAHLAHLAHNHGRRSLLREIAAPFSFGNRGQRHIARASLPRAAAVVSAAKLAVKAVRPALDAPQAVPAILMMMNHSIKNTTSKETPPLRERVPLTFRPLGRNTLKPLLRRGPGEGFDKAGAKSVHGQFRQRGVNLGKLSQRVLRQ
jgi:hypothetical protein